MNTRSRIPLHNINNNTQGLWQSGDMLECIAIHDELEDVRSYTFKDPKNGCFKFKAGQHISLALPLSDGEDFRTFTIASSPTRSDSIQITVKTTRPEGGTAWMRKHLRPGTQLRAFGATGHFTIEDHPTLKLMLISAGSGITPVMSMLRWLSDRGETIDITFLHYVQTPKYLLFPKELSELDAALPNLHIYQIPTEVPLGESWSGLRGLVSRKQLKEFLPHDQTVFCCGPAGFMDRVRGILTAEGLDLNNYHQESFSTPETMQKAQIPDEPPRKLRESESVTIRIENQLIEGHQGELLLEVLRRNKVVVPTGCKTGLCGTCRLKKTQGEVMMKHQGGLNKMEEQQGYILACCSTLETDLNLVRG